MNMKNFLKESAINNGMEVVETPTTLQWVMRNGQTCIHYFTENGEWLRSEHR